MKKNLLSILSILVMISLAACGAAEPTLSSDDIADTAVAIAWLSITQTQAAMPTATIAPPTSTIAPTLAPLSTLPPLATLAPATLAGPTTDICNQVPPAEPKGTLVNVEFTNESQGLANFTFGMSYPNDKGECVNYTIQIGKGVVSSLKVLTGCYWGYAWITGDEPSVARTGGTILCVTDPSLTYHVTITKETIVFK